MLQSSGGLKIYISIERQYGQGGDNNGNDGRDNSSQAHTGEKPYSCPKCSYCCITKRNLDRHITNNHVREGERRGPRERKSRYRRDEYSVVIDDIEMGTIEEGEKIDHHYVLS
ncbi:unnamed protein product, partial [Onchocerca flexuosa]|uniref:C2H2-type domain-containing protein n=1 Tax=Onchocerca flexuosa TaxID=387005 RepID=A0A183I8P0_9BILA